VVKGVGILEEKRKKMNESQKSTVSSQQGKAA
jgi:hypothetical protein